MQRGKKKRERQQVGPDVSNISDSGSDESVVKMDDYH